VQFSKKINKNCFVRWNRVFLFQATFLISSHIDILNVFYSRDAILARYWLWPCFCPSVSHKSMFLKTDEWIELVWELPSSCPTLRLKEIIVSPKIRVLSSGTVSQTPTKKISPRHIIVEKCYQLSLIDVLNRCRSTKLTILACDDRPLLYHSDHQALSTARFRRASKLANTCYLWGQTRFLAFNLVKSDEFLRFCFFHFEGTHQLWFCSRSHTSKVLTVIA